MGPASAHILVVDDNPATQYSTSRVLKSAGFRVSVADTGLTALEMAGEGIDLVVLDVNLPDIDGFEVCRRLRESETTVRLPVVHLSATFVQDDHKVLGLQSGADGYLTHPIEPPVLIATVKAFLRARQAEIELRRSEVLFAAIFENAPNGVVMFDDELVVVNANPAMCELLTTSRENLVGRSIHQIIPESVRAEGESTSDDFRRLDSWRGVVPFERSGEQVIQLEWNMFKLSEPKSRLAIVNDISERLQFELEREELLHNERASRLEAERTSRIKDEFLATLSHELRTPLNAIVGWSQLLRRGKLKPKEVEQGIAAIERNAQAQAKMISDLLDVSRIVAGKIRLEMQWLDPAELIDAAITAASPTAAAKSIQLSQEVDSRAGQLFGDPSRLQQVIWNLISNAVKFTPPEGRVHVTLQRVASHIDICVRDNGQGIAPPLLRTIFERFSQGDASTTREHGGLGLGLAIAKQLVEMHGGTISAESGGEGQGSVFTVHLRVRAVSGDYGDPLGSTTASSIEASEVDNSHKSFEHELADLTGVRVLLIEDDADSRAMLHHVVAGCGAETLALSSVQEGLSALESFDANVLISDLGMPGQDGLELIREVRARGWKFPAIALTAFAGDSDRDRVLSAGFQLHLAKPVDAAALISAISELTHR